jgi:TolA-binding protein
MKLTNKKIHSFLHSDNHEIRKSILENNSFDGFDKDVVDGLLNSEIISADFQKLDQKHHKTRFKLNNWLFTALFILIGMSCIYFLIPSRDKESRTQSNNLKSLNQKEKTIRQTPPSKDIKSDNFQQIEYRQNEELSLNKKATSTLINNNEIVNSNSSPQELEVNKMSPLNAKVISKNNTKTIIGKQGIEVFILDYKTLDYRNYRKGVTKPLDALNLTNGTPANASERNTLNQENQEIEYNYFSYLKETMKLFDKKTYTLALENFNAILNTYPDDINALFYGGLCYFEQKQYNKSIAFFDQARKNSFLNFREEAEWLLLQSYVESNDFEKANALKNEIVNGNGFYAKQAKEIKIE